MLKQLLQLLLNTRTTPEEAAHSAMFGFVQISAGEDINAVATTNTANEGQWVHLTLVMSKGAPAKVQVSNADNIVVKFFSIIGGG